MPTAASSVASAMAVICAVSLPAHVLAARTTASSVVGRVQPEGPQDDPTYQRAQKLYEEGKAKFETAHYREAIERWTEAYTILPASPEYARIKVLLLYDLATAQERAFQVDRRPDHLRQAKILLENFEQSIPAIYGEGERAQEERTRVEQRIAGIEDQLNEAKAEQEASESARVSPEPTVDRSLTRRGKIMAGVGGGLLGLGAAGSAMFIAGLVIGEQANDLSDVDPGDLDARERQFERGEQANAIAITGGVIAGAGLVSGAVLLVMGIRDREDQAVAVAPMLGPGLAGASLRLPF